MDRIATVEAIPVSYPEPNDFDALRHLCLAKVTTEDGVVGWGESITQFTEANFATKAIIEGMAERVVGKDPLENIAIWHAIRDKKWWYGYRGGIASYAISAIDMALWDIKGKLLGTSVLNLLGGAVHEKLPAIASCHAHYEDIGAMVEEAQEWVAPGMHGVKVGFGKRGNARLGYEHDRDVEYIRRMREGLGPDKMIMIDCGWAIKWDVMTAVRRVQAFEEHGLHWIEEPLLEWDPEGYREPARQDDDAHRLRREGVGPRGLRAGARDRHRRRRRHRPRAGGGHHRLQEGDRAHRVLPPPVERPRLVERDLLGREPGDQLQHAVGQALRDQAAAQPDAARARDRALRARRWLRAAADEAGPRHRDHRGGRRPLPQREGAGGPGGGGREVLVIDRREIGGGGARGGAAMAWSVGAGLEGKGVIVTGATGGIGKAVAEAFATTGAKVMAVDLDQARVDEVVAGFEGSGHVGVAQDLRDLDGHAALIAAGPRRSSATSTCSPTSRRSCGARAASTR